MERKVRIEKEKAKRADLSRREFRRETGGGKITGKVIAKDLGIAVAIALVVSVFASPTIVHETSMQPTIDPGDFLIMSKQSYRFGEIERGDVIIFKSNIKREDTNHKKLLIKRVIGIPGDVITISGGNVYINGKKANEKYIGGETTEGDIHDLKVGDDEVFVLGDHRSVSKDSRELGCISQKAVRGKAVFRVYPFSKIGGI